MTFAENTKMAFTAIWSHKLRSFLTLLGVIIGVTTIIAMMTLITGLQRRIEQDISALAPNTFQVQRYDMQMGFGGGRRPKYRPLIKRRYAEAIKELCPSVMLVGPEVWSYNKEIRYRDKKTNPNVVMAGGTPEFMVNNGYYVEEGRFITYSDDDFNRQVTVIGYDVKEKLFEFESPVGRQVKVDGRRFTIIGYLEEGGSLFGDFHRDNCIVIPLSTFEKLYGDRRSLNITVQAKSAALFEKAKDEVIEVMRAQRGLKPGEKNNFGLWSSNMLIDSFNQMTLWVKIAAVGICAVSLLVAGIGIMNIMLVSVTERTREIGVRKAIGGKKRHILTQFVIEAVVLSEIGGIIGVGTGYAAGMAFGAATKIPTAVPVWAVILGLVFCSAVGMLFGIWPAAKAAKLEPIEALRYE